MEAEMAEVIVGSKLPQFASDALKKPSDNTKTGYGQNGYMGASSDTDLSNPTRSALSVELFPEIDLKDMRAKDKSAFDAPQTRTIMADPYPLSFGMDKRSNRNT
jgi:hypothetical protein